MNIESFKYTDGELVLAVTCTPMQAATLIAQVDNHPKGPTVGSRERAETEPTAPRAVAAAAPPATAAQPEPIIKPEPKVDSAAISRLAASAPAPAPKAPKAGRKAAAPPPEPAQAKAPEKAATPPANGTAGPAIPAPESGTVVVQPTTAEPPEEVLNATSLRAILGYLTTHGVSALAELQATCLAWRDQVPVLGRISNLDERVERTLGVMDNGEGLA